MIYGMNDMKKMDAIKKWKAILISNIIFLIYILLICGSCVGNNNTTQQNEELVPDDYFPWEDVEIGDISESIVGLWFEPHGASHNIVFNVDSTFVYHTFAFPTNSTHLTLVIKGIYQQDGIKISLIGDDGWKSTMYLRHNGTNYFMSDSIKKRGIYLVKSSE